MTIPRRISLSGSDWQVQGWIPYEWDLVGPVRLATGGLDLSKVLHGETAPIRATVPGCVQVDLLAAGVIEDPYCGLNSRLCEWVKDRMWCYQRTLAVPPLPPGARARLRLEGIDHSARVYVNGDLAGRHSGTFVPAIFDVTALVHPGDDNVLQVVVDPAPESVAQVGRTGEVRTLKPRFAYKWDFTTRLVPLGLWEPAWLLLTGPTAIDAFWVHGAPRGATAEARVNATLDAAEAARLEADVEISLDGRTVATETFAFEVSPGENRLRHAVPIPEPQLWWTRDLGDQPVYSARLRLRDESGAVQDEAGGTFGIRQVEMLPNTDQPAGARNYTLALNGRKVFLKGFNWAPVDQRYGAAAEEKYAWLIRLARESNANMLRVWGGGLIEKEIFYDLCDRNGILVWQELPQSSSGLENSPARDPAFVDEVARTARSAIRRKGGHPSLVIWGAGNELTGDGLKPLDERHPVLAAVGEVVAEEHPNLIYVPTSPLGPSFDLDLDNVGQGVHHDIHGPWKYAGVRDHYALFNANDCLFHGETGTDGCSGFESMLRVGPAEALWPPEPDNPLWRHHAGWWIPGEAMRRLFGPIDDLRALVRASQFVQAESLRYAVEANRRRKYRCSATLVWQLNEPWPNLACTSNVDYYGHPKLAYYFLRRAFAPRHVSLRHEGIAAGPGSTFAADVFVHNDLAETDARADWRICDPRGAKLAEGAWTGRLPADDCRHVETIQWPVPADLNVPFFVILELRCGDGEPARNTHVFCPDGEPPLAALSAMPPTRLELTARSEAAVTVRNAGETIAWLVRAEIAGGEGRAFCPDNGRTLLPGEQHEFRVEPGLSQAGPVAIGAWNADEVRS